MFSFPGKYNGDEQLHPVNSGPEEQAGGSLEQVALQGLILSSSSVWKVNRLIWTKWRLIIPRLSMGNVYFG